MIRVYFETEGYAELVAIFQDEDIYLMCLNALKKECRKRGFLKVTEVMTGDDIRYL